MKDAVRLFEQIFRNITGAKYSVAFPYGRSGLYAILKALKISRSKILIPAYTCIVVPHTIVASGNIPQFVDIKLSDFNMDLELIKPLLNEETKVVVPTHMYGYPMDVKALRDTLHDFRRDDIIVEDACLAIGAGKVGLYGDFAFYSFNVGKHISTVEGGMVTTNNEEFFYMVKNYRDRIFKKAGILKVAVKLLNFLASYLIYSRTFYSLFYKVYELFPALSWVTRNWSLENPKMPRDFLEQYTNLQAKIGIAQSEKIHKIIKKRKILAKLYLEELESVKDVVLPLYREDSVYSHFTIMVDHRDHIYRAMISNGIHVGKDFDYAIPYIDFYSQYASHKYPKSLKASRKILNLPLYPSLSYRDIYKVCTTLKSALKL